MPSSVTAGEIDEVEQSLIKFHSKHENAYGTLDRCVHKTCVDAKLGIAWLRSQLAA
jgi:hypothetical protein